MWDEYTAISHEPPEMFSGHVLYTSLSFATDGSQPTSSPTTSLLSSRTRLPVNRVEPRGIASAVVACAAVRAAFALRQLFAPATRSNVVVAAAATTLTGLFVVLRSECHHIDHSRRHRISGTDTYTLALCVGPSLFERRQVYAPVRFLLSDMIA